MPSQTAWICASSALLLRGLRKMRSNTQPSSVFPDTGDDVLKTGERIYNLERYYNNLAGFREGSDSLPERFLKEPSTMPGSKGHVCELDRCSMSTIKLADGKMVWCRSGN